MGAIDGKKKGGISKRDWQKQLELVLEALREANKMYNRPVSVGEIIEVADKSDICDRAPITHSGWTVFDFGDRVSRCLNHLVKDGKVELYKTGCISRYYGEEYEVRMQPVLVRRRDARQNL